MKRFPFVMLTAVLLFALIGCGSAGAVSSDPGTVDSAAPIDTGGHDDASEEKENTIPIRIDIGERSFSAALYDNDSARTLAEQFPLSLDMSELNGNEKYYYMESALPTDPEKPDQLRTGDIMLFGSDCLVLFYESFSSGYSYTRLGRVDDPAELAEALGTGNATVTFRTE